MNDYPVPEALQPYMPLIVGIVTALVIFIIGWIVAKWIHSGVLKLLRRRKVDEALARFLASLAQWMVIAATIITALARVGVETTSLVALLGTAGLAIGLALQGNFAHFASGVMLLLFRPFMIGDVVDAGGKNGTVFEIGLFATVLETADQQRIIIPNSGITGGPITNYTVLGRPRAQIKISVPGKTDPNITKQVLERAVASVPEVLDTPAPEAVFTNFGGGQVEFTVMVCTKPADFLPAQPKVRKAIFDALVGAGIITPG